MKIYLAGPVGYGTPGIEWKQEFTKTLRTRGHTVYDPIDNDILHPEVPKMNTMKEDPKQNWREIKRIMQSIFNEDCRFITDFDYLICYFSGRALGTASEQGIAYYLRNFLDKKVQTISLFDSSFKPDEWTLCCSDHVFFNTSDCLHFLMERGA